MPFKSIEVGVTLYQLRVTTLIAASPEICFDLARSVDADVQSAGTALMTDILRFTAPLGPLGWIAERILVGPHLRRFLIARGQALQAMAKSTTRIAADQH